MVWPSGSSRTVTSDRPRTVRATHTFAADRAGQRPPGTCPPPPSLRCRLGRDAGRRAPHLAFGQRAPAQGQFGEAPVGRGPGTEVGAPGCFVQSYPFISSSPTAKGSWLGCTAFSDARSAWSRLFKLSPDRPEISPAFSQAMSRSTPMWKKTGNSASRNQPQSPGSKKYGSSSISGVFLPGCRLGRHPFGAVALTGHAIHQTPANQSAACRIR